MFFEQEGRVLRTAHSTSGATFKHTTESPCSETIVLQYNPPKNLIRSVWKTFSTVLPPRVTPSTIWKCRTVHCHQHVCWLNDDDELNSKSLGLVLRPYSLFEIWKPYCLPETLNSPCRNPTEFSWKDVFAAQGNLFWKVTTTTSTLLCNRQHYSVNRIWLPKQSKEWWSVEVLKCWFDTTDVLIKGLPHRLEHTPEGRSCQSKS